MPTTSSSSSGVLLQYEVSKNEYLQSSIVI